MRKGDFKGTQLFKQSITTKDKKYKDIFKEYVLILKTEGRAEETIRTYHYHNKYFLDFVGEEIYCSQINLQTVQAYILYLKEEKHIENGVTINSYIGNISPILKYAMKKGYIQEDFEIPFVKYQETFKQIYTEDELSTLLTKPKDKTFNNIRTWAIIWTLASTGIRAKELRQLKVMNVNMLDRVIAVNHTKNRHARYLPISNSLGLVLEEYLKMRKGEGEDYLFCTVFGEELARTTLQKSVMVYCNKRGVAKHGLHLFRHTFVTNAVNKNVSPLMLQKITGHQTMKQLNRYYNAKTSDIVNIIDDITPHLKGKESHFKNGGRK